MSLYIKKTLKKIGILFAFIIISGISILIIISLLYPMGYREMIKKYSDENEIDPFLVAAIINVESGYNNEAVSSKNARGLMQIGPQTGLWAKEELKIENYSEDILFDPEINIKIGTWYLAKLNSEFENRLENVLAAYNAGSGNVGKWLLDEEYSKDKINLQNIPFKETDDYIGKVKRNYKVYSIIYRPFIEESSVYDTIYIEIVNKIRDFLKNILN